MKNPDMTSHDHVFRACTRNVPLTSWPAEVLAKVFWSLQSEEDLAMHIGSGAGGGTHTPNDGVGGTMHSEPPNSDTSGP